jgi:AraC-like DNA-binding protein
MTAKVLPQYGEGEFISYEVMDGVDVTYNDFIAYQPFSKDMTINYINKVIIINYCVQGKFKYVFSDNETGYVCDGEMSFWGCENRVKSADFSLKRYKGVSIVLSLKEAAMSLQQIFDMHNIKFDNFAKTIFDKNTCFVTRPNNEISNVFNQFYNLPKECKIEYLKVKVLELLILISVNNDSLFKEKEYLPQSYIINIQKIKDIIEERYNENITIEEFSKITNVNTTYIKKGFKYLYGDTINSYRKKYRMIIAEDLVKNTDCKIIDIAEKIGYSSPSKFTEAFKDVYKKTPTLYRKS